MRHFERSIITNITSTLKMETRCSSGTLVSASRTIRCYNQEDHPLNIRSEDLKIHIRLTLFATWKFSFINAENFKKTYGYPLYVTPFHERTAEDHIMWKDITVLMISGEEDKYEGWNCNSGNYLFTTDTK